MLRGVSLVARQAYCARFVPNVVARVSLAQRPVLRTFASRLTEADAAPIDRVQQITNKIREIPDIESKLNQFQTLLKDKGFSPNEPPSMLRLMSLLADKEVKACLKDLKQSLDDNGVEIRPEDYSMFLQMYGLDKQ